MATPANNSYEVAAGALAVVAGRGYVPLAPTEMVADGVWTWFTDPRAVYRNGATYIGWVNSSGDIGISKYDHAAKTVSSFTLSAALELDDHNNPAIYFRPDGRIMAFYCKHPDATVTRYRVSTNAEDISAWGSETQIAATVPTYSNPFYLSDSGRLYLGYRSGVDMTRPQVRRSTADNGATWDAETLWINNTGARPYYKACSNGAGRIDFLVTTGHPRDVASSIYHAYMQLDGTTEKFYSSNGTYLGTSFNPTAATQVYDGSSIDGWVWDIQYGPDGHPWVLFAKFQTTTDHRYMFARWTGSAWTTPVQICAAGSYLYLAEAWYSGGLCFDSADATRVFVSVQVSGQWEIQEYATSDNGATWAKLRDITTGSAVKNCRPYSPRNRDDSLRVLWWRGSYSTYIDYDTALWGSA